MPKRRRPVRPMPELSPGQIAFHGGITVNRKAFTLEAALALYPDRKPPAEALLALKEASIARTIANANATAKAGTLRPMTADQRQRQRAGLDTRMDASTKMGLYDSELVAVPVRSKRPRIKSDDKKTN